MSSSSSSLASTVYRINTAKALVTYPNADEASQILRHLIRIVTPLLIRQCISVKSLVEFYPKNPGLLGLNVNAGARIMVRLRTAKNAKTFLPMDAILGTLVHELVHCRIGAHSFEFYQMVEKWEEEVMQDMLKLNLSLSAESMRTSAYAGVIAGMDSIWEATKGHRLGGSGKGSTLVQTKETVGVYMSAEKKRALALAALEKRLPITTQGISAVGKGSTGKSTISAPSSSSTAVGKESSGDIREWLEKMKKGREARRRNDDLSGGCSSGKNTATDRFSQEEMDMTLSGTQELTDLWGTAVVDGSGVFCPPCQPVLPVSAKGRKPSGAAGGVGQAVAGAGAGGPSSAGLDNDIEEWHCRVCLEANYSATTITTGASSSSSDTKGDVEVCVWCGYHRFASIPTSITSTAPSIPSAPSPTLSLPDFHNNSKQQKSANTPVPASSSSGLVGRGNKRKAMEDEVVIDITSPTSPPLSQRPLHPLIELDNPFTNTTKSVKRSKLGHQHDNINTSGAGDEDIIDLT